MRDVDLCLEALAMERIGAIDLSNEDRIEAQNIVSAHYHALDKDSAAKVWWKADIWHPAIGRALKIDRTQEGGVFALAPFRLHHDGERHLILAAYPSPKILGPVDLDWLCIEAVIAWDPVGDKFEVMGDAQSQLVGSFPDNDEGTVFASAREFFTAWAVERAAFFSRWCQSRKGKWAHGALEYDLAPGKLIVGDVRKARWSGVPKTLHCRGIDPKPVNGAILRQSNLPRAVAQEERFAA